MDAAGRDANFKIALYTQQTRKWIMDKRKLAALARKNAAKSGTTSKVPKGFGKKYDANLSDDPVDEATIKERDRADRFFAEMRKREF